MFSVLFRLVCCSLFPFFVFFALQSRLFIFHLCRVAFSLNFLISYEHKIEINTVQYIRFHNIIREEYEYEKQIIEERLKEWPIRRLKKEGFALLDLSLKPMGNFYQEKVYR